MKAVDVQTGIEVQPYVPEFLDKVKVKRFVHRVRRERKDIDDGHYFDSVEIEPYRNLDPEEIYTVVGRKTMKEGVVSFPFAITEAKKVYAVANRFGTPQYALAEDLIKVEVNG
jgi:hypothetical protein